MHKKYFEKRLAKLTAKRDALTQKALASESIEEIRAINEQLAELNSDISDVQEALASFKDEDEAAESRAESPATAETHNAGIVGSFTVNATARADENILDSKEYRTAFMRYFQRGIAIPADLAARVADYVSTLPREQRAGDAITTENAGAVVIPTTVMRDIIKTVRTEYGNIYAKVRKTSVAGGVEYPIGDLVADFHWITETTVSPEQDAGKIGSISFKYNTAEIRIAQTFLSALLSIEAFEADLSQVIAKAYMKAMDTAVIKGTGVGQPLGILADTRVTGAAGHTIALTGAEINNWTAWRKKFFAKIPIGYRSGEFIFNPSTVDAYLETMADGNNNPIFRQATGLEVNENDRSGRFFGKAISLVEPDILADYDTASSNDVIGIFWQPNEYLINENFGFMARRYYDEDRNKWINKALTVCDGKLLNANGVYLITKA